MRGNHSLSIRLLVRGFAVLYASLMGTTFADGASASTFTVLHSFTGGSDGGLPLRDLIADSKGNLYGATGIGGTANKGVVFKLSPPGRQATQWTETVLHSFTGSDGHQPNGDLITDSEGNLYGMTYGGGTAPPCPDQFDGCGVVFRLAPPVPPATQWIETVLYSFCRVSGCFDGRDPDAGLIAYNKGNQGNLYGTTSTGGAACNVNPKGGCGVVFKLSPPVPPATQWTEAVLYSFGGGDGVFPEAGLIADSTGNLYGTTYGGGADGFGAVFKLSPPGRQATQWTETVLHSFTGAPTDGANPDSAGLIADSTGSLYGTTPLGGAANKGVVFKLSPPVPPATQWTETVLYSFHGSDGANPYAGLTAYGYGNLYGTLYGTTAEGGTGCADPGCGAVFKLSLGRIETVLYSFTGGSDGGLATNGLIADTLGNLYGTTQLGGAANKGVAFKLSP